MSSSYRTRRGSFQQFLGSFLHDDGAGFREVLTEEQIERTARQQPLSFGAGTSLADWCAFWGIAKTDSLEGEARFQAGDLGDRLELDPFVVMAADFRLTEGSPGN